MSYDVLYCIDIKEYGKLKEIIVTTKLDLDAIMVNDYCPLHYCIYRTAAEAGYERYVDLILKLKASVHSLDGEDKTPLYYSVRYGLEGITKKLLARGAKPGAVQNSLGWAAPHFAAAYAYNNILNMLINRDRKCVNQRNTDGETPLHVAAALGHTKTVELLVDRGSSPHVKNTNQGYTPLHKAAINGHTDTAVALVLRGASVHEADNNALRKSPIQVAGDLGWFTCAAVMTATSERLDREAAAAARKKRRQEKEEAAKKAAVAAALLKEEEKLKLQRFRRAETERKRAGSRRHTARLNR
jgi:hypothetical protein